MDEAKLLRKIEEVCKDYPQMFIHPGVRDGEVWIGDQLIDFAMINVGLYQQKGLRSARMGDEKIMKPTKSKSISKGCLKEEVNNLEHRPLFANLREYLTVLDAVKEK